MTKARIAGFFYLLVFITGLLGFFIGGKFVVLRDPVATASSSEKRPIKEVNGS